jgi:methylated-DNA-[protein]-cysteine S-methyltransferase
MKTFSSHSSRSFTAQARLATPLGPMTAAATARGLAGLWFDGQRHHPGPLEAPVHEHDRFIAQARRELALYFAGGPAAAAGFSVPLDPQGTPFQQSVWALLRGIGHAQLARYGDLARRLGRPQAARAVGAAVGRNPLSIIVPCHRVLGQDGSLTGYAGGLDRKRALLQLEGAPVAPVAPGAFDAQADGRIALAA